MAGWVNLKGAWYETIIFAPGSSLGGARPKASVIDQHGQLSIAKFPKETDEYSVETWEEIALRLAGAPASRRLAMSCCG